MTFFNICRLWTQTMCARLIRASKKKREAVFPIRFAIRPSLLCVRADVCGLSSAHFRYFFFPHIFWFRPMCSLSCVCVCGRAESEMAYSEHTGCVNGHHFNIKREELQCLHPRIADVEKSAPVREMAMPSPTRDVFPLSFPIQWPSTLSVDAEAEKRTSVISPMAISSVRPMINLSMSFCNVSDFFAPKLDANFYVQSKQFFFHTIDNHVNPTMDSIPIIQNTIQTNNCSVVRFRAARVGSRLCSIKMDIYSVQQEMKKKKRKPPTTNDKNRLAFLANSKQTAVAAAENDLYMHSLEWWEYCWAARNSGFPLARMKEKKND